MRKIIAIAVALVLVCSNAYAGYVNAQRYTQQEYQSSKEAALGSLTAAESREREQLVREGVNNLPYGERNKLLVLHDKHANSGYVAMSDNEIYIMRQLNNRAVNSLPRPKQERLMYLIQKMVNSIR